jgi:hypothetical protein
MATSLTLLSTGCGKQEKAPTMENRETLKTSEEVQAIHTDQSAAQKAEVERAFADLEKEIRELEVRVEKTEGQVQAEARYKIEALKNRRDELRKEYNQAKFDALVSDVKSWGK